MIGVRLEIVELLLEYEFLVDEVAVGDEVVHVRVVQRRPGLQVGVVGRLFDVGTVDMVHGHLVAVGLRHYVGALIRRHHSLGGPCTGRFLIRNLICLAFLRHDHFRAGLSLLLID